VSLWWHTARSLWSTSSRLKFTLQRCHLLEHSGVSLLMCLIRLPGLIEHIFTRLVMNLSLWRQCRSLHVVKKLRWVLSGRPTVIRVELERGWIVALICCEVDGGRALSLARAMTCSLFTDFEAASLASSLRDVLAVDFLLVLLKLKPVVVSVSCPLIILCLLRHCCFEELLLVGVHELLLHHGFVKSK